MRLVLRGSHGQPGPKTPSVAGDGQESLHNTPTVRLSSSLGESHYLFCGRNSISLELMFCSLLSPDESQFYDIVFSCLQ